MAQNLKQGASKSLNHGLVIPDGADHLIQFDNKALGDGLTIGSIQVAYRQQHDVFLVACDIPQAANHRMFLHHYTTDNVSGEVLPPSNQSFHGQTVTKPDGGQQLCCACKAPEVRIIEIW